nr:MAG TPA: hypothetical protein [Caudoviricetes sp.]
MPDCLFWVFTHDIGKFAPSIVQTGNLENINKSEGFIIGKIYQTTKDVVGTAQFGFTQITERLFHYGMLHQADNIDFKICIHHVLFCTHQFPMVRGFIKKESAGTICLCQS